MSMDLARIGKDRATQDSSEQAEDRHRKGARDGIEGVLR